MRRAPVLAAILALACAPAPSDPERVVREYFHALGRDPLRTLPVTTDAFHRSHELMLAGTPADPSSVDRQQVAWLAVQREPELNELARSLSVEPIHADAGETTAQVVVRVAPQDGGAPPFEQRFTLTRTPRTTWRIDSVTQSGVGGVAAPYAYAAYPCRANRERIASQPRRSGR